MTLQAETHPDLLVAAEDVSVRHGDRLLLDRVELAVHRGEIVSLIGPNGGGKSTLVKVLLGLVRPESGRVTRAPGLRIGYVPQKLALDSSLPLQVRRFMTLTRKAPIEEVEGALTETGVEHLMTSMMHSLSGGELQRVALARAILHRPDFLVLDEPVQGVDFAGEAALYALIGELRDRYGCGVLLVSHDLHVVMGATDYVVCLNSHVCCAGAPDVVVENEEYRRLFGPRAELAHYSHHHDHSHGTGGGGEPVDHWAVAHAHDHDDHAHGRDDHDPDERPEPARPVRAGVRRMQSEAELADEDRPRPRDDGPTAADRLGARPRRRSIEDEDAPLRITIPPEPAPPTSAWESDRLEFEPLTDPSIDDAPAEPAHRPPLDSGDDPDPGRERTFSLGRDGYEDEDPDHPPPPERRNAR